MRAAGGRQTGRLLATVSMPALAGPILGPVVGGLIVGSLSWRWIFYVNVPVCAVALVLAWRGLPADGPPSPQRLDLLGLTLLSPALAGIIYGLSQVGAHDGLGHPAVVAPLAGGIALLAAFTAHALRTFAEPVVDLRLFRSRPFAASSALLFLSGRSMFGAMQPMPGSTTGRGPARSVSLPSMPVAVMAAAFQGLDRDEIPHASSTTRITQQVGGSLGAAVLAVILERQADAHAGSAGGRATAFGHTFWWALAFTALAVIPALLLPRRRGGDASGEDTGDERSATGRDGAA